LPAVVPHERRDSGTGGVARGIQPLACRPAAGPPARHLPWGV